jgi:hypothetical protein
MIRKIGLLLLAFCLSPVLAGAQQATIVGHWYGTDTQQKPGYLIHWIGEYTEDGRYRIQFESFQNCALISRDLHEGHWSMEGGNIQALKLDFYNGLPNGSTTRYEILEVVSDHLRYRSTRTGYAYQSKRVDGAFTFPACGPAS